MDDNRTLTLPSGERIPASHNLRIIFTTCAAINLTMATISRCAVVRLENVVPKSLQYAIKKDELSLVPDFTNNLDTASTTNIRDHSNPLARSIADNIPVILTGPSASGKTFLLRGAAELTGTKLWILTITSSTTVKDILDHLFKMCTIKRYISGHVLEPTCTKMYVCFKYLHLASDSVLELLRVLVSCRSFWHSFKRNGKLGNQQIKLAADILFFATTHGTTLLPEDLTRHFDIVRCQAPSIQDLESICSLIVNDVVDTLVVDKMIRTFKKFEQIFEGSDLAINPRDLIRWAIAVKNNPCMLATFAHSLFSLRSNASHIEESISTVIRDVFGYFPPTFCLPESSSIVATDDLLKVADATSTVLTCPGHIVVYGSKGSGRTTTVLAALHHCNIQVVIPNGREFEEQIGSALKRVEMGETICLVLTSLVITECNACERLVPLITSTATPFFDHMDFELDEQKIKKNLRIVFIIDEDKFESLIPTHLINYFTIIHSQKWSKKSVEQGFKDLEVDVFDTLSNVEYISTKQMFQVKKDFNKIHTRKSHERKQKLTHLTSGLNTLETTVKTASDLNVVLSNHSIELDKRNQEASEKLDSIVSRQQSIEKKRFEVEAYRLGIEDQQRSIQREQEYVHSQLSEIEPIVKTAKEAVASITKLHLTELRSMVNPPDIIKQVIEAVCLCLGHTFDSWKGVQSIMKQDDFISSVLSTNTISNTEKVSKMELSVDAANRASKACGPLLQWLLSQIRCAEISAQIQPLRNEISRLATELENSNINLKGINDQIEVLLNEVDSLKIDYDLLTRQKHRMQECIQETKALTGRAERITRTLDQERSRWKQSVESMYFDSTNGDTLLSLSTLYDTLKFDITLRTSITNTLSWLHHDWQDWVHLHGLPLKYTLQVAKVFNTELPVIYDPEGIFIRFIQSLYLNNVVLLDMNEECWNSKLEQSIVLNNKILLQNFVHTSHFMSLVNPLNSNIFCVTNTLDSECISFQITPTALESICTDSQLEHFNPQAHTILHQGECTILKAEHNIHALEAELLQLISSCDDLIRSEGTVNRIESIKVK